MDLQSPDVGRALTRFFGISGEGRLPMMLDQVVVPIVIVGNVEADLRHGPRAFASGVDLPALAANFGAYSLRNTTIVGQKPRSAMVEKIVLYTQTTAFFRLTLTFPLATAFTVAAQRRYSAQAADPAHCALQSANVPATIPAGSAMFSVVVQGNGPFTLDVPASGLIVSPGGSLDIACTSPNLATSCSVLWHEEDES